MLRSLKLDGRHSRADQDHFRRRAGEDAPAISHEKLDRIARALIRGDSLELSPDAEATTGPMVAVLSHGATMKADLGSSGRGQDHGDPSLGMVAPPAGQG
jgi:hypothetical protein